MEVYLRNSKAAGGPYDLEDIRTAVSAGALPQGEFGWCRGLDAWVPVPNLLQFVEHSEKPCPSDSNAVDPSTLSAQVWQPPSEEVFFARLARTFTYQLEPLYEPFADLRKWMSQDAAGFGTTSTFSEALTRAKHEHDPVIVKQVLRRFAKSILFFSHRTAMGFALTIRDCTPLAEEDRLLLGESYSQLLDGPLTAFANQGSVALEAFQSGDPDKLQAWFSFCLAELANAPAQVIKCAAVFCFGNDHVSDLTDSCAGECKASAQRLIEFAAGTIRIFDKAHRLVTDAAAQKMQAVAAVRRTRNDQKATAGIGCFITSVVLVALFFTCQDRDLGSDANLVEGVAVVLVVVDLFCLKKLTGL